jgi:DNA polymerase III subunit beta
MKFIVSSTQLLKNLQAISGVLSSNNALPILDNFLFEVEDSIRVSASDLETTMTADIPLIKSEEKGSIAIPAKILLDTLKTLPDTPITFVISPDTLQIEMSAGEGKYKLSGHQSDEYPKVPEKDSTESLTLHTGLLADAIAKTLFATGNDELRPVMSGVYFLLTPDGLTFVATDAHKLVKYVRKDATSPVESSFILPKKPLNQLKNLLSSRDEEVRIEYSDNHAFFTFGNFSIVCRLIEGKYPNFEAVIPKENPNKLHIDRLQLSNCLRRVAIFANQSTHQVRFRITGRELVLSAEDIDFANEARERLACSYEGDDLEIGFNSRFVLEMLGNLSTEEVSIEMSTPNRAGILIPVDPDNHDEEITMLVMPVMLNS